MTSVDLVVRTGVGLHARPAALLVAAAREFACNLTIAYNRKVADAKSIIQILALGVEDGEQVTVQAEGNDEDGAIAAVIRLFQLGFRPDPSEEPTTGGVY